MTQKSSRLTPDRLMKTRRQRREGSVERNGRDEDPGKDAVCLRPRIKRKPICESLECKSTGKGGKGKGKNLP